MIVYTDGSCLSNPGPGGWAFLACEDDGTEWAVSGGSTLTTNNRMELLAVISVLKFFPDESMTIYSDSKYVIDGITKWMDGWKRRGFSGVKNLDLWEDYVLAASDRRITFVWVKGHSGDPGNTKVDEMARSEAEQMKTRNQ